MPIRPALWVCQRNSCSAINAMLLMLLLFSVKMNLFYFSLEELKLSTNSRDLSGAERICENFSQTMNKIFSGVKNSSLPKSHARQCREIKIFSTNLTLLTSMKFFRI
jgi:hypothetical protein